MKLTKAKLQQIIKEELQSEGFKDEIKVFQKEIGEVETGWKEKATQLAEREKIVNSVNTAHNTIAKVVKHFKGKPVSEALNTVKSSHAKRFDKAMEMLESILEDTGGWIKENQ